MQKKEPTPSAKREVTIEEASKFLSEHYASSVTSLEELKGGKHSKAFSYAFSEQEFIIRFSNDDGGFLKDKYAFEHFHTYIPIPEIIEIGRYIDLYYCISERISGETVRDQYNKGNYGAVPFLYETIEKIAKIEPVGVGYGYLDLNGNAPYQSTSDYIESVYNTKDLFDWDRIFRIPFVDKNFTDYTAQKMEYFTKFATAQRELLHGDFGADNVFIQNNVITGIIDWEKMRIGDHFLDVGRVLLFCPNRQATTSAVMRFYENKKIENWKERVAMGVYHVVLTNYAYAALGGNEASCRSSEARLKELEQGLGLI